MVYFRTKNPNSGKCLRALDIRKILPTFGIFYDHLVHFVIIWYIYSDFGIKHQKIWQPCFEQYTLLNEADHH
jgi:hypothetical protein